MNQANNNSNNQKVNNLISSEDVQKAVSGDQKALLEQLERAKQAALVKYEASKDPKNNVSISDQKSLEAEYQKKEAELRAAMVAANAQLSPSQINELNLKNQQEAKEREQKRLQAEAEIQMRATIQREKEATAVNTEEAQRKALEQKKILEQEQIESQKKIAQLQEEANRRQAKVLEEANKQQAKQNMIAQKNMMKEQKRQAKLQAKQLKREKSNFRYVMTVILFIGLFAIVYFLPEISSYIAIKQAEKNALDADIITSGNLECVLRSSDDKYDYEYLSVFTFSDSKLDKLTYKVTTKGDKIVDAEELSKMKEQCDFLEGQVKSFNGVNVRCSLSEGVNVNEQILNYADLKVDDVTTAYLEAGGVYPNYQHQQDIDQIEKNMKASGYACERHK